MSSLHWTWEVLNDNPDGSQPRRPDHPIMPRIVCVLRGPATRGTENAHRGGCMGDTTVGRAMSDALTTSASRSQISTS
jgi:hypothetical protein